MRWGFAAFVLIVAVAAGLGQQPSSGPQAPGGLGFGAAANQPFNQKSVFPDAKSLLPDPGIPAVPPSWNPFTSPPPPGEQP